MSGLLYIEDRCIVCAEDFGVDRKINSILCGHVFCRESVRRDASRSCTDMPEADHYHIFIDASTTLNHAYVPFVGRGLRRMILSVLGLGRMSGGQARRHRATSSKSKMMMIGNGILPRWTTYTKTKRIRYHLPHHGRPLKKTEKTT